MLITILILVALGIGIGIFLQTERFGKHPNGERLIRMKKSRYFVKDAFQNLENTPMLTEGVGYANVLYEYLVSSKPNEPKNALPSKKTNLRGLSADENVLIWMGHSTYFIQLDGKTVLVDPVLSGNASPITFTTKAYQGSDIYTPDEIPEIDYLFLSHDHWDHMDYKSLKQLKPKIKKVITGLGNGAHLERWGYDTNLIVEKDWNESVNLDDGFIVHVSPARHFSGRGFKRNQTLWVSFVLTSPSKNIYIGGDSGYGSHFREIGERHGPFDLVILENGQYDQKWKYIHMLPGEHLKVAEELKAKSIFPVHSGKFTLANHDWDEPFRKITEAFNQADIRLITPKIGEQVNLQDGFQNFEKWWETNG